MIQTTKIASYTAFGFHLTSDIPLPELNKVGNATFKSDLIIRKVDLSSLWSEYAESDSYYYVNDDLFMIRVPDVAIYKVENGRTISYYPLAGASEDHIRLYLLGTCMGVILMQRKILPVHGSCVAIDGKAYAIVGDSGAGKSTLASAFMKRGYPMLTDDVIAVTLSNEDSPLVIPSYPQQKLWQESLEQFGIDASQYEPIYDRETKYAVPVKSQFFGESIALAGLFVLSEADQDRIEIIPIEKLKRFPILYYNTYRNFLINRFGLLDWHFNFSAKMVNKIKFYRLIRPSSTFTANELVDHIVNLLDKKSD